MIRYIPLYLLLLFACNTKTEKKAVNDSVSITEDFFVFAKADSVNPVLLPDSTLQFLCPIRKEVVRWEAKDVFNPAAIVRNDTVFLLYRAEDLVGKFAGTSRIGLAWSTDGLHFTKNPTPVFYPDNDEQKKWEWEGGCEDPRVVQDKDGTYYMTYTAYDGDKARMLIASSRDIFNWTKHGHIFAKVDTGAYINKWSKSGSILSRYDNGTPIAARVNGKYWMYGGDVNIWVAYSDDLINWTPVEYSENEKPPIPLRHNSPEIANFKIVFGPRNKSFDSDLVEPGPPAILTDSAIWLIYNSRNTKSIGDTALPEGTYAAGYVKIDRTNPTRLIDRADVYFIKPDKPYEMTGQVNHVCFLEGLVRLKEKWFLYYGTADSKIAVAVKE